jgi:hypothetical protein
VTPDDELLVSGGGYSVATGQLAGLAASLQLVDDESSEAASQLRVLRVVTDPTIVPEASGARASAVLAAAEFDRAARTAGELALAVRLSAEAYGAVESGVINGMKATSAVLGNVLGHLAPFLLLAAAPFLAVTGLGVLTVLGARPGGPPSASEVGEWMRKNPQLVNNPATAAAVRLLFSSSDDVIAGFFGVPVAATAAAGDEGLGLYGIREAAGIVLGIAAGLGGIAGLRGRRAGASGPLIETPVTTSRVSAQPVSAPSSLRQLADRMPVTDANGAQIRVERYEGADGEPSFIVYLGGTVDLGAVPTGEAFDMTSNVESMSAGDGASYRAALEAMRDAGIRPGDPVFEVGYSQGGLLAVQVEQSGGFNVQGVVTLGSPVGQFETTAPTLSVAHSEDIVPALGGLDTAVGDERVFVGRTLFDDAPMPTGDAFPAHNLNAYRETAGLADSSSDPRVRRFLEQAQPFLGGTEQGTAFEYRAERTARAG